MTRSDYRAAGRDLREIRSASSSQQKELRRALPKTPGGSGLGAALELLNYLEEHFPWLDERERVMLVSGDGLRMLNSVDAIEIREKLGVGWLKSEDRDAIGLKVGLLIAQGGLPASSVALLRAVQKFVDRELVKLRLPRMQVLEWSKEKVLRRGKEQGVELDLEEEATRIANEVLKGYRETMDEHDPLVFGVLTVKEARLWQACGAWVVRGKDRNVRLVGGPQHKTREQVERDVVRVFDQCVRHGVEGPWELQRRMDEKMGRFNGARNVLRRDTQGRMRYGDGVIAERDLDGHWSRPSVGYGDVFKDKGLHEVMEEIERVEKLEGGSSNH